MAYNTERFRRQRAMHYAEVDARQPRTDVHSPTNLVTENYEYVESLDLHPQPQFEVGPQGQLIALPMDPAEMEHRLKMFRLLARNPLHTDHARCDHCGHNPLRYIAIMHYVPDDTYISVGEQCLDNRFGRATIDFQMMRKAAELDRETHRIKVAVAKFVADNPDLAFLGTGQIPEAINWNNFIVDLSGKLRHYGELSEKQIAAARKTVERIPSMTAKHDAHVAEKAAEKALEAPVVEGRQLITGVVLSVREPDEYAQWPTWKMLVQEDRHFKLWGNVSGGLDGLSNNYSPLGLVGVRVSFVATVEKSSKDESFGFYSRPSKAQRLPS